MKDINEDQSEYIQILNVFKKYNIRFFFYVGGNDSMDTVNKIGDFIHNSGWECNVIGLPKTIDNDLSETDHCPGYGSAAKYIANSIMELRLDTDVYDIKQITVVEIMGRNAGWLTAASVLGNLEGLGPDLVYLPEKVLDIDKMFADIERILETNKKCFITLSEGVKTKDGKYVAESLSKLSVDAFGHRQLGGAATILADNIRSKFNIKSRAIEFSLLQRCAAHLASKTDIKETLKSGKKAVIAALDGKTNVMVSFTRISNNPYKIKYDFIDLDKVANKEKMIPLSWIKEDNTGLTQEFFDYILPLVQGEDRAKVVNGLPRFAKLKKVKVQG